jgi:hypothetical protein
MNFISKYIIFIYIFEDIPVILMNLKYKIYLIEKEKRKYLDKTIYKGQFNVKDLEWLSWLHDNLNEFELEKMKIY